MKLRRVYTRFYTREEIILALDFLAEAQKLLERENSKDIGQYGYAGELRVDSTRGISNPLALKYMKKGFGEFKQITNVCDLVEETFRKYDSGFWNFLSEQCGDDACIKNSIRGRMLWLGKYIPPKNLEYILLH